MIINIVLALLPNCPQLWATYIMYHVKNLTIQYIKKNISSRKDSSPTRTPLPTKDASSSKDTFSTMDSSPRKDSSPQRTPLPWRTLHSQRTPLHPKDISTPNDTAPPKDNSHLTHSLTRSIWKHGNPVVGGQGQSECTCLILSSIRRSTCRTWIFHYAGMAEVSGQHYLVWGIVNAL